MQKFSVAVPIEGTMQISSLDGYEINPGVILKGEPTPIAGTDKLSCLAIIAGQVLVVLELKIKFSVANLKEIHFED